MRRLWSGLYEKTGVVLCYTFQDGQLGDEQVDSKLELHALHDELWLLEFHTPPLNSYIEFHRKLISRNNSY